VQALNRPRGRPYREKDPGLVKEGVEMTAIWLRLQENFGYKGGYSSIGVLCIDWKPTEPERLCVFTASLARICKVDLGPVGQLYDPVTKRMRTAYVFVATLGYSRHQYAELVL